MTALIRASPFEKGSSVQKTDLHIGLGKIVDLVLQNGDQCAAVDHNHSALRSSMIPRGERESSSGIAAISAPSASICSAVIRRPRLAIRLTPFARARSSCARAIFERPPNSVLDRSLLDRGHAPGEGFDILRKTDHVHKLT
jgi:hypothetical protein